MYFAKDLQSKEGIMNKNDTGVTLLDRDNKPFFAFYEAKQQEFVPLSQIPLHAQQAIIATEDKDFYTHPGFSIKAIVRSIWINLTNQDVMFGGSTLTQQLVKNALLTPKRSFLRKYQEVVLASEIERRYPKAYILEMYLNSAYFGEGAFGIERAAQVYFGKSAKNLTLAEASLLAAVLPSPSKLSPFSGNIDQTKLRQDIVLTKMAEQNYITLEQKSQAEKEKLTFTSPQEDINRFAPHFAILVRNQLIQKYGEETISRSGFKVYTTLDTSWQQVAEKVVKEQVEKLAGNKVSNGAAVAIDPKTGEILVFVGSYDWYNDSFGKVSIPTSIRQPGSSFKPIVYAKALEEESITPATMLKDQPITYKTPDGRPYSPQNYDRRFRGNVTARRALGNSLNVPSVEVLNKIGVPKALEMGNRLGLTTLQDPSQYGLSLVLGTAEVELLELTNVYATFANSGMYNPPVAILAIEDKYHQQVYTYQPNPKRAIDENIAFLISSMLSDNNARAEVFGKALTISRPAAVKTGTTENYKDAWTLGYTPSLAIGVWVGNNDGTPMDHIAGSLGAAPIWARLMETFLAKTPIETFIKPPGVISSLCAPTATASATLEYFLKGSEKRQYCVPTPRPTSTTPSPTTNQQPSPTTATLAPSTPPSPTVEVKPTKKSEDDKKENKKESFYKNRQPFLVNSLL